MCPELLPSLDYVSNLDNGMASKPCTYGFESHRSLQRGDCQPRGPLQVQWFRVALCSSSMAVIRRNFVFNLLSNIGGEAR